MEALARRYTNQQQGARIPLIRQLLAAALRGWADTGHGDEAAFVRRLFFADGGSPGRRRPRDLLEAARRDSGLDEDRFDERRRARFRQFARFLVEFVRAPRPTSPAATGRRDELSAEVATDRPLSFGVRQPTFRFDALGGGSQVIRVYPGVGESVADRTPNGTFFSGDVVLARCKTRGRTVRSRPELRERPRESDIWIRIDGTPGLTQYATLTYGDMTRSDLDGLPPCADG